MDAFIRTSVATADYVKGKLHSKKDIMLSFDEYNVDYSHKPFEEPERWIYARPIAEGYYSVLDALAFSGLLCTLLSHADRVKIACLAQLVNVIPPISTRPGGSAIRQAIFYPFMHVSHYAKGVSLLPVVHCHNVSTETRREVKALHTAVSYDEKSGMTSIFILNCDSQEDINLSLDMRSFEECEMLEHIVLESEGDIYAFNSFEHPDVVKPHTVPVSRGENGAFNLGIPHLSWNVIRMRSKVY
jgi:alpha-N-arabinofuranosidase